MIQFINLIIIAGLIFTSIIRSPMLYSRYSKKQNSKSKKVIEENITTFKDFLLLSKKTYKKENYRTQECVDIMIKIRNTFILMNIFVVTLVLIFVLNISYLVHNHIYLFITDVILINIFFVENVIRITLGNNAANNFVNLLSKFTKVFPEYFSCLIVQGVIATFTIIILNFLVLNYLVPNNVKEMINVNILVNLFSVCVYHYLVCILLNKAIVKYGNGFHKKYDAQNATYFYGFLIYLLHRFLAFNHLVKADNLNLPIETILIFIMLDTFISKQIHLRNLQRSQTPL